MHNISHREGVRTWGITSSGKVVGVVLFDPIWRGGQLVDGTIHICLARSAWGREAIQFAAQEIIPQIFNEIPSLLRLSAYTPSHYRPGLRVAESLGFKVCGKFEDAVEIDGVIRDITVTGLTRREWLSRATPAMEK